MKRTPANLTATLCLTIAALLGSVAGSSSQSEYDSLIRKDYDTAYREWKPRAEQGSAEAQNILGAMYFTGKGAEKRYDVAQKWYTLAAEQGHARAQLNLGKMFLNGQASSTDRERTKTLDIYNYDFLAFMWFDVASRKRSTIKQDAINARDALAKKMSPGQIKNAKLWARDCISQNYKKCYGRSSLQKY